MALTLQRPRSDADHRSAVRTAVSVTTGPLGVLTAACLLTTGLLVAVSDLVTRLG